MFLSLIIGKEHLFIVPVCPHVQLTVENLLPLPLTHNISFLHRFDMFYKFLTTIEFHNIIQNQTQVPGFLLRILVAGERCNITEVYFERGSTSEYKIVIGYRMFASELCIVNREFTDLRCLMHTLNRGTQCLFSENICLKDDLRSRIFGTIVVKFLACLPPLGFSNI